MYKYKIVLEYDGTNFSGWNSQKDVRSIQKTLETAARNFLGVPVKIQGAGRTDAGVHALAQTAHLESSRQVEPEILRAGINEELPESIHVLQAEDAHPLFHARKQARRLSYLYLISQRRFTFGKRYVWYVKDKLDFNRMNETISVFQGFHDFISFTEKKSSYGYSTKVNVEGIWLKEFDDIIAFRVVCSHFLWKMVRCMVGVTVEAGRGNLTVSDIEQMVNAPSDIPAKFIAPASGLFLEQILYGKDELPEIKLPEISPPILMNSVL
jgi:tRNA pseudouridine38-40 synthase